MVPAHLKPIFTQRVRLIRAKRFGSNSRRLKPRTIFTHCSTLHTDTLAIGYHNLSMAQLDFGLTWTSSAIKVLAFTLPTDAVESPGQGPIPNRHSVPIRLANCAFAVRVWTRDGVLATHSRCRPSLSLVLALALLALSVTP
jgi:hypothetical protein